MQRKFRLAHPADFERVRRDGISYAHPFIVLFALASELPHARFAVAAGARLGGAVVRNHLKRRLREALRPLAPEVTAGHDLLLIARAPLREAAQDEVNQAVRQILQRAGLLE